MNEWEIIDHLTNTYRSLYLYRGDSGWWAATLMVVDDRDRMPEMAYDPDGRGYVFLDGSSLQVNADGQTRGDVLRRIVGLLADADSIITKASESEAVQG